MTFAQQDDWSTKAMIKRIVMSATYRQRSDARDSVTTDADPQNLLLYRQNLRRLTAESIRDAVLHTSGRLDRTMFGPSVRIHLTAFMEGRGRPAHSGPAGWRKSAEHLYRDAPKLFVAHDACV